MKRKRFTLANVSKGVASETTYNNKHLSNISNISRGSANNVNKPDVKAESHVKPGKPTNNANLSKISKVSRQDVEQATLPYIKDGSELIIPMDAPDKYRWWSGGQDILTTLLELDAADSTIEHYVGEIGSGDMWTRWLAILEARIAARPVAVHGAR